MALLGRFGPKPRTDFRGTVFPLRQDSARKPAKRLRVEESGATERMRAAACGGTKDAESVTLWGKQSARLSAVRVPRPQRGVSGSGPYPRRRKVRTV